MKTTNIILTAAWALLMVQGGIAQTIVGSLHDFSNKAWNTYSYSGLSANQICKVCHTPHDASTAADEKPLWNHAVTTSVFTIYSNATFDAASSITQPDGPSKLCLSCHDGTIALDNFGGLGTSTAYVPASVNVGTDLSNDHPVSFTYDAALATTDPGLYDPTTQPSGLGGTISNDMLYSGKLQCASCHNPHDPQFGKFLRKSNTNSALCLTCHNK